MRIAVITPYHAEKIDTLMRCINSVESQTVEALHVLVGDGATDALSKAVGARLNECHNPTQHIRLPVAHGDYGDTPRLIGTTSVYTQGVDALCWLDADCWFEDSHIETLMTLANREVASVVTATRMLRRPDGSLLDTCSESDGQNFCDTNCYLVMREVIPALAAGWGFKPLRDAVVGDRRVWAVAQKFSHKHCAIPTVNYETKIASHYLERDEKPPEDARMIVRYPNESFFRSIPYREITS